MAYASDLLAFPFRSVALLICVNNLAIDDDVSMYVVASPTSRSASLHYANPSMYNAFLVLFKAIMRNGREEKIDENDGKGKDVNL